MERSETGAAPRRIRLAILDDSPFLRFADGRIGPRAATFHRFAEAVVVHGPFEPAIYLIPVRSVDLDAPPISVVDESRLIVTATDPFEGIAGYARRAPGLASRNWPVVRKAVEDADLVWIKAPASNALLALLAARRAHRPFFTWVAGSARAVVRGQGRRGPDRWLARAGALLYDSVTRLLERAGPSIRLGAAQFTSIVTADEISATRKRRARRKVPGTTGAITPVRIAWAGRMVADKGLEDLFSALASLRDRGVDLRLELLGDGPDRSELGAEAARLGIADSIRWLGYIADRAEYMDQLRSAELFVLPSRAEGVPKVVIEAMAAGLPVIATRVGGLPALERSGAPMRLVARNDPGELAAAIAGLAADGAEQRRLRDAGLAFAAEHTVDAQAAALVRWMRSAFPTLPWVTDEAVP